MARLKSRQAGTNFLLDMIWFMIHIVLNILFYAIVVFAVYKVGTYAYEFSYQVFGDVTAESEPGRNALITIEEKSTAYDLAETLEVNKIIVNRYSFYLKAKVLNKKIMAGTFMLNSSMTYDEILNTVTDYKNAIETKK